MERISPSHYISRLRLTNFRNYANAALDLTDAHVVLTGPNGAGKTNLLEAVSLLAPGRGLRRAGFDTLALHQGAGDWAVALTVQTIDGAADLGTGQDAGGRAGGRRVRINGAAARSVEQLGDYVRILWLTPAQDGLFTGPASDRRRFFDQLVSALVPGHGAEVGAFEKSMRQRNRLLEQNGDRSWLSAIEVQMAAHAAAIHFARVDTLARLNSFLQQHRLEAFPAAFLAMSGEDSLETPQTSTELEHLFQQMWREHRPTDRAAGRTTIGPHRTDILVTGFDNQVPAEICSTGEQKALLVGLIMAHARLVRQMTRISPLLLLDEIAAHLDPDRRVALFSLLNQLGSQCWMTGTDRLLFEPLGADAQFYHVRDAMALYLAI